MGETGNVEHRERSWGPVFRSFFIWLLFLKKGSNRRHAYVKSQMIRMSAYWKDQEYQEMPENLADLEKSGEMLGNFHQNWHQPDKLSSVFLFLSSTDEHE